MPFITGTNIPMPNMKYMEEKISIPPYLIYMSMDMLTSNMIRQSGILKPNIPHPIQRIIPNHANGLFILKYLIYFDLFQFGGYRRSMLTDVVYTEFIPYEPIECVRTIDSEKYNQYIVEDFCNYIHTNNLYHLLKTKEELYTP